MPQRLHKKNGVNPNELPHKTQQLRREGPFRDNQ